MLFSLPTSESYSLIQFPEPDILALMMSEWAIFDATFFRRLCISNVIDQPDGFMEYWEEHHSASAVWKLGFGLLYSSSRCSVGLGIGLGTMLSSALEISRSIT